VTADASPEVLARRLEGVCQGLGSVVVAYSGGVDSAVLLAACHRALGDRAVGVLAMSPSFPEWEREGAIRQAQLVGAELVVVHTQELGNPRFAANTGDRCYFCKASLLDACDTVRRERGLAVTVFGANTDDLQDHRPGHQAASERGAVAPLLVAGLDKAAVRVLARHYGLPSADKPAMACLSSRFPVGTAITEPSLRQVSQAEHALHRMGFTHVRVRYHGDLARLELGPADFPRMLDVETRAQVAREVRAAGFRHVTLDLEGYRQGGADGPRSPSTRLPVLG
jgi:uncharacterized protein